MTATKITDRSDPQWVRPRGQVISNAGPTTAPFVSTDTCQAGPAAAGRVVVETADLTMTILGIITAGDTNTVATGLKGLVAVAWQGSDVSADDCCVHVSSVATGTVYFSESESGTREGWIWCLHRN